MAGKMLMVHDGLTRNFSDQEQSYLSKFELVDLRPAERFETPRKGLAPLIRYAGCRPNQAGGITRS
jgi:hypothetical protein